MAFSVDGFHSANPPLVWRFECSFMELHDWMKAFGIIHSTRWVGHPAAQGPLHEIPDSWFYA